MDRQRYMKRKKKQGEWDKLIYSDFISKCKELEMDWFNFSNKDIYNEIINYLYGGTSMGEQTTNQWWKQNLLNMASRWDNRAPLNGPPKISWNMIKSQGKGDKTGHYTRMGYPTIYQQ